MRRVAGAEPVGREDYRKSLDWTEVQRDIIFDELHGGASGVWPYYGKNAEGLNARWRIKWAKVENTLGVTQMPDKETLE